MYRPSITLFPLSWFIIFLIFLFMGVSCPQISPDQAEAGQRSSVRCVQMPVRIQASVDMEGRRISGHISFEVKDDCGDDILFHLPSGSEITSVKADGDRPQGLYEKVGGNGLVIKAAHLKEKGLRKIEMDFVSRFKEGREAVAALGRKEFLGDLYWGDDFFMMLAPWCPVLEDRAVYDLEITVPSGLTAISEADYVIETGSGERCFTFVFPYPRQFPTLVVGRFRQFSRESEEGVGLNVYLLGDQGPGQERLADAYLDEMGRFISLYSGLIGPYPYKRFSVVANSAQTGFGLPTYTLIGERLMPMPFIRKISLGHEILHSWFGNSVLVDYSQGNWCEGLTTYLADHYYRQLDGTASAWRHDALAEFAAYVTPERDMPLSAFTHRSDRASKAVGYEKGAMVFHMLRRLVGDEDFFRAIKLLYARYKFRPVAWGQIEEIFSEVSGMDLDWFFSQWLERTGMPRVRFRDASLMRSRDGGFVLELDVVQELKGDQGPWRLVLPFLAVSRQGNQRVTAEVSKREQRVRLSLGQRPLSLFFDPEYDLARELSEPELPAMIATLIGDPDRYVVIGDDAKEGIYEKAAEFFESEGFKLVKQDEIKHQMVKTASFLVLGRPKGRLSGMIPSLDDGKAAVTIAVKKNPLNRRHVVAAVRADDPELLKLALSKVPHYGKYSMLEFDRDGRVIKKVRSSYVEGVNIEFQPMVLAVASSSLVEADSIYRQLRPFRVVYMGETHDDAGFHRVQFEVVKSLFESGKEIAVGMEMFQAPFQKVIDDYLAGRIDERQFLKESEYFKRWRFNYRFYRPVIEYCKEHGIPVIALNIPAEVSKKIARSGLESLNEQERSWLPEELDLSNRAYRYHLQQVFAQHREAPVEDFEYFFQAQIAWDESMGANIVKYLRQNPERSMVVLVGSGHVAYRFGIPSRVERRGIKDQAVVLSGREKVLDPDEADFFLFPPVLPEPFSAKLGVLLSDKQELRVEKVVDKSPADQAGIKPGDVIKAIDGVRVKSLEDLRIELFFKKKGQKVEITVLRTDENGNSKEIKLLSGPLEEVDFASASGGFHSRANGMKGALKAGHKMPKGHPATGPDRGDK